MSKKQLQDAAGIIRDFLKAKKIAVAQCDSLELAARLQGNRHLHHAQQQVKLDAFYVRRSLDKYDPDGGTLFWGDNGWGSFASAFRSTAKADTDGVSHPPADQPSQWVLASDQVLNHRIRCEEPWDPACEDFVAQTPLWLSCLPFSLRVTRHDETISITVHPNRDEDRVLGELNVDLGETAAAKLPAGLFVCANCSYIATEDSLPEARDISQRHEPGDTYSNKECPKCSALMFPFDKESFEDKHLHGTLSWTELESLAGPLDPGTEEGKYAAERLQRIFSAPVAYLGDSLFQLGTDSAELSPKVSAQVKDDDAARSLTC